MPEQVETKGPTLARRPNGTRSGSETRQRRASVPVRYSDDERAEVHRRAERTGLSAAAYIRMMTLEATPPRAQRRPSVEHQVLARILGQLGKIGSNVNQIARAGNSGEMPDDRVIEAALADLYEMRVAVLDALGRAGK